MSIILALNNTTISSDPLFPFCYNSVFLRKLNQVR